MGLLGSAVLAIWNDIAPGGDAEFNHWHTREHVPERVGVPGFLRGRRYLAVSEFVKFLRGVRQPGRRAKRSVTARAFDGSPPVARHSRRSSTEIHSEGVISATSSSDRRHEVAARTR